MSFWLWGLAGLVFVIMVASVITLLVLLLKEKKEPKDAPIVLNFLSAMDKSGYFVGTETKQTFAKGNRKVIEFMPKDVNPDAKEVKPHEVIVDQNFLFPMPKGSISREKAIDICLPKDPMKLPEAFRNTTLGKGFMWAIKLEEANNAAIASMEEGSKRKTEILKKLGDGEMTREFMAFSEEMAKDAMRSVIEAKSAKETKSSTSTPTLGTKSAT